VASAPECTVFTDYKNLLTFTTTKELNRRQVRWAELLRQYKFKICYTLGKDNGRADALSRRSDYIKEKAIFNQSILRRNVNGSLSPNVHEINTIARIVEDDTEEFTTDEKVRIPPNLENDLISRHHDDAVSRHAGIEKTLEQLRRRYTFPKIKEKVTQYIRKCSLCKQNKNERHAAYGTVQFSKPPEQP
jgi:hypothetical protein